MSTPATGGRDPVPDFMTLAHEAGAAVYRWSVLPRHPGALLFFGILGAVVSLPGPMLLVADVLDRLDLFEEYVRGAEGVWLVGLILCAFTVKAGPFFAVALLGRCRLAISPEVFDYEVTLLGRRLRSQSRHLAAREVISIALKEPHKGLEVQREGGRRFRMKIPIGAGALSLPEALRLRDRWLADMGRAGASAA